MADLNVEIGILRASNLPAADYNGLSDPYVMAYFGLEDVARTSVKNETLEPVWNECFQVSYQMFKKERFIVFEVWDSDTMSKDDKLGECRLFLPEDTDEFDLQLFGSLAAHMPSDGPKPTVTVRVTLPPQSDHPKADAQGGGMPGSSIVGSLMREILPASELWPGMGRCRFLPHNNEVILEVLPHIVVTSDPRNNQNEMSPRNHGSLLLTQYRLVFIPVMFSQAFAVALPAIQTFEMHTQGSGRRKIEYLELIGKDSTYFRFGLIPMVDRWNLERKHNLAWILRDIHHRCQENEFHCVSEPILAPRWRYNPHLEFSRMVFTEAMADLSRDGHPVWRETALNHEYGLCPTYPRSLIVPKHMNDQELEQAAQFRSKQRLPVLSWVHPESGGLLCRCSQPMTGLAGKKNSQDEKLLLWIRQASMIAEMQEEAAALSRVPSGVASGGPMTGVTKAKELHIIDCRSDAAAAANKWLGKGTENTSGLARSDGSDRAKLHHANIGNIHDMRGALRTLTKAIGSVNCGSGSESSAFTAMEAWLDHNRAVLAGSNKAAALMHKGHAVMVHCSDGWDRTSQVCALSQLLLDPFYRTFEGFATVVEKDWLAFGHMFEKRCGNPPDDESSPIFLQFIDCVWSLTQGFPKAFEFNESYLLFLIDACYSGCYGTFLGNCEREREELRDETHSVWDTVNTQRTRFLNPLFKENDNLLRAGYEKKTDLLQANLQKVRLWPALYRQSFGRNFVSNEALIEYHSTLECLRQFLGDDIVDVAAEMTKKQLSLYRPLITPECGAEPEAPKAANRMIGAAAEGVLEKMQAASAELSAELQALATKNCCNDFDSLVDGSDESVSAVVNRIVGEDLWHMSDGTDVRLNMSLTSISEDPSQMCDSTRNLADSTRSLVSPSSMTKPYWVPDESVDNCAECTAAFSFMTRRHHCRGCGKVFCDKCSSKVAHLPWRGDGPHRVCQACCVVFDGTSK